MNDRKLFYGAVLALVCMFMYFNYMAGFQAGGDAEKMRVKDMKFGSDMSGLNQHFRDEAVKHRYQR